MIAVVALLMTARQTTTAVYYSLFYYIMYFVKMAPIKPRLNIFTVTLAESLWQAIAREDSVQIRTNYFRSFPKLSKGDTETADICFVSDAKCQVHG